MASSFGSSPAGGGFIKWRLKATNSDQGPLAQKVVFHFSPVENDHLRIVTQAVRQLLDIGFIPSSSRSIMNHMATPRRRKNDRVSSVAK